MEQTTMKKNNGYKIAFFIVMSIIALVIRYIYRDFQSPDYYWYLRIWFDQLKEGGGFLALSQPISNYSPLYIYIMAFLTYLPVNSLYSIKAVSVIFDFVAAYYVFKLLEIKFKNHFLTYLGAAVTLFLPTVIINGAYASQCDIIFSAFLLGTIYYLIKEKNITALIFFGIAVSFKLQAAFLAPVFLILLLKKQVKIWQLFLAPLVYLGTLIPAYLIGRPFRELITIYFTQVGYYPYLTMNCANIYQFFEEKNFDIINRIGIIGTLIIVLFICFWIGLSKKKLDADLMTEVSVLILLVIPFFLPQMHERYYFPAEVLAVVYAFYNRKYFYVPIALIVASFLSYGPFIFNKHLIDMRILAVTIFMVIIFFVSDISIKLRKEISQDEEHSDYGGDQGNRVLPDTELS
ncbi:MAG: glycosyltransferase family 39 protein [Clostridia bacterium]|nr:glycosyltransferase family 39 protein [Clostridia bacterium]